MNEEEMQFISCEPAPNDNVNHPKHYSNKPDGIETIYVGKI